MAERILKATTFDVKAVVRDVRWSMKSCGTTMSPVRAGNGLDNSQDYGQGDPPASIA
jgi:hypothetical protein